MAEVNKHSQQTGWIRLEVGLILGGFAQLVLQVAQLGSSDAPCY